MTYRPRNQEFVVPLPIADRAREAARQFAQQQPTPEKAEQIRLNTLAVSVVNDYLQLMGIPTDLSASDSWNPVMRLCCDVADLVLPGLGRLECRPVLNTAETCSIPPEVWEDRIGYVIVQIDEVAQEAAILGYVLTATDEELLLEQVRSPEDLLDHLASLQSRVAVPGTPVASSPPQSRLGQWLQGVIDAGWQTVESLLNPDQLTPAFAFRGETSTGLRTRIQQAKLIDFPQASGSFSVALVVAVEADPEVNQVEISLQVFPLDRPYLPSELEMAVLDGEGNGVLQVQAHRDDRYVQLQVSGEPGEVFSVQLRLAERSIAEAFQI